MEESCGTWKHRGNKQTTQGLLSFEIEPATFLMWGYLCYISSVSILLRVRVRVNQHFICFEHQSFSPFLKVLHFAKNCITSLLKSIGTFPIGHASSKNKGGGSTLKKTSLTTMPFNMTVYLNYSH